MISTIGRADPEQRERILRLMRRAEIATTGRTTAAHRLLADRAGIAAPDDGTLVDDWLYNMSRSDAAKLGYYLCQPI